MQMSALGLKRLAWKHNKQTAQGRRRTMNEEMKSISRRLLVLSSFLSLAFFVLAPCAYAGITATFVKGAFSISGLCPSGQYDSATVSVFVDPAVTDWIAWNNVDNVAIPRAACTPYVGNPAGGVCLGPGGFGTDDSIVITVTNPLGIPLSVKMDQNNAFGNSFGPQNVIFGTASGAPDVIRTLNPFSSPSEQFLNEVGAHNSVFTAAGMYQFHFSWWNDWCGGAGHSNTWLLIHTPEAVCGDGVLNEGEQCDDANTDDFDGCLTTCQLDSDSDGAPDDADICPGFDDSIDSDADSLPNGCDVCPFDADNDNDGDGICGDVDVCPGGDDTQNADGDALPDFCDVCPVDPENDADGDGLCESSDNCPTVANTDQTDTDGDTDGDACDLDDDDDGAPDDTDNCPLLANPDQSDNDGDGAGDACDTDDDNDGILDATDQCLFTAPGQVVDSTGCSIADLVPCENSWKNHGAYVRNAAHAAERFVEAGLISEAEKDAIVSAAAQSNCGK